jgi:hypothetical protein
MHCGSNGVFLILKGLGPYTDYCALDEYPISA